jgi:hypothetical protein
MEEENSNRAAATDDQDRLERSSHRLSDPSTADTDASNPAVMPNATKNPRPERERGNGERGEEI